LNFTGIFIPPHYFMEDLLNYIPSIITTAVGLEQVKTIEEL